MSMLHFESHLEASELNSLDLPVEIRKPDFTLAARGLSSQPVELAPGSYYFTAKLPAGQQLYGRVEVEEGKEATAILAPEPEDASPHEWQAVQHYILGPSEPSPQASKREAPTPGFVSPVLGFPSFGVEAVEGNGGLEPLGTLSPPAKLRGFRGNILQGAYEVQNDQSGMPFWLTFSQPGFTTYNTLQDDTKLVQLLQPEVPAINMVLPVSPGQGCQLVLMRQPNGFYSLDANLSHPMANTLLRYLQKAFLEQASSMIGSPALSAEQLLYQKRTEPIAAAVGAYALLRLGDLERLHEWTENLRNFFTWLPDGITIRGEHLARLGNHEQALGVFLDLPSRGLPIFSDGLSYALDRLGLYIRIGEKNFEKARLDQAKALLEHLQRFAAFVDFRRPLLTFTGLDPGNPSDVTPGGDLATYGGVDIPG
jgi:hypothetical protein